MSNIVPSIESTMLGTALLRPLPDVEPFSIRSGYSYESILSDIRVWLRDTLVPYLEDNSAAAIFQENVDSMVDRVNLALTDQAAVVTAALNTAVNEVITAQVPIAGPIVLGVLQALNSATLAWLDARYSGYDAPAPSGGDDTTVLTALINAAAQTRGEVRLKHGVYLCNLDLAAGFVQATIRGRGRTQTTLRGFVTTKPVVKFNGGSGSIAGGGLRSLNVDGVDRTVASTVGIAFSGCGGVSCEDVAVSGCAVGVLWWNERPNDFTEFDTFEGSIYNTRSPFVYRSDNGSESFHGSGCVGKTIVGMPGDSTSAVISTVGNALPYNAPMSMHVFFSNSSQFLINYAQQTAGRAASFFGRVNIENAGRHALGSGSQRVLFAGTIEQFGTSDTVLGNIFLCSKITYEGGNIGGEFLPISSRATLKSSPTIMFDGILAPGQIALIAVHVRQSNYDYAATLLCYQSLYDGSGTVTVLAVHTAIDNNNPHIGDPNFIWNAGLYFDNGGFSNAFTAFGKMTILGGAPHTYNLAQSS